MDWTKENTCYLKKILKDKREKQLKKNKNGAMAFEIIDFLASNPDYKYYGPELANELGLSSTRSIGNFLKAQNAVMEDLGYSDREDHGWFVDWEWYADSCNYWLSTAKSEYWNSC